VVREKPAAPAAFQHRDIAPGAIGSVAGIDTIGAPRASDDPVVAVVKGRHGGAALTIARSCGRAPRSTP